MNRLANSLKNALVLGMALFLVVGCASTRSTNNSGETRTDSDRVYGGIAAVASESVDAKDTVMNDDMKGRSSTFTEQLIAGRVAGVQVIERPGGGFSVRIRGKSSILGSTEPLYVVDGMQILNNSGHSLSWLNIHDIQKIEVLKDVSATALYGTRGSNGVVVITTKRGPQNQ